MFRTKTTTWATWLVVWLLLAANTASATTSLLSGNSRREKIALGEGVHQATTEGTPETHWGWNEYEPQDAADHVIAPTNSVILRSGDGAVSGGLRSTGGLNRATTTIDELLSSRTMPGQAGVVLNQRTVSFADIHRLSIRDGAEYALTREGGQYVLRSGLNDAVAIPSGVRPIVHTHPPDISGFVDTLPSRADINVLNSLWARNPAGPRPVSQIITGPGQTTIFRATGMDLIPQPKVRN